MDIYIFTITIIWILITLYIAAWAVAGLLTILVWVLTGKNPIKKQINTLK